jgi:O-acetyl-ADP-ribose deacetylase (regulator of RNase III)
VKPIIIAKKGDITNEKCDAIVNPANSYGFMSGGVALAIKNAGGKIIEEEAIRKAPIPLGCATATTAGGLRARYVIHAPTMKNPAERIDAGNVAYAVRAALLCAEKLGIESIAFPGMGTGVGGVKKDDATRVMIEEIINFFNEGKRVNLKKIILIGFDDELYNEFGGWMKKISSQETV